MSSVWNKTPARIHLTGKRKILLPKNKKIEGNVIALIILPKNVPWEAFISLYNILSVMKHSYLFLLMVCLIGGVRPPLRLHNLSGNSQCHTNAHPCTYDDWGSLLMHKGCRVCPCPMLPS